ncbi:hypothetical protein [Clostridium baratii]|uniref:hypothetical protein n=1 Tax=Clostridium baratii TaxID=1561 RepID=UPI0030D44BD5
MKITAEFNSNEELINFIKVFGEVQLNKEDQQGVVIEENKKITTKKESRKTNETDKKDDNLEIEKEQIEIKEDKKESNHKVTKEEVRAVFTKLIKAGKQKEAKELTAKYGASKLPDVKEEDYAAIKEEAEALL